MKRTVLGCLLALCALCVSACGGAPSVTPADLPSSAVSLSAETPPAVLIDRFWDGSDGCSVRLRGNGAARRYDWQALSLEQEEPVARECEFSLTVGSEGVWLVNGTREHGAYLVFQYAYAPGGDQNQLTPLTAADFYERWARRLTEAETAAEGTWQTQADINTGVQRARARWDELLTDLNETDGTTEAEIAAWEEEREAAARQTAQTYEGSSQYVSAYYTALRDAARAKVNEWLQAHAAA